MKKEITTTAITRTANYPVRLVIVPTGNRYAYQINAYITIAGKEILEENLNTNFPNFLFINKEIANALGIKYQIGMRMNCDITEAITALEKAVKSATAPTNYDGEAINSGFGFAMANTKKNWDLVNRYGYDAIEMVS